ncbi:MAG: menaquinone biosynthesis protein [Verrucomicrobiae bacterium]|nr:menaquinone biosynthesis protein [Verrucomicrobiae bacterium]
MHCSQELPEPESAVRRRIGSVPYLNAVPLTHTLGPEVVLLPPSRLAVELHAGRLDAALVSVTEPLRHPGYHIVDGVGIISRGPVASVILAHRRPLEALTRVHADAASCTSVALLRMLLAARGIRPEFVPFHDYASAADREAVLLIGNPALEFRRSGASHDVWDLGAAWWEWTGLPFVFAVWAVRDSAASGELPGLLRAAAAAGCAAIPELVEARTEFDRPLRQAYLGGHIHYDLGAAEKDGLRRFAQLLAEADGGRAAAVPRFV